MPKAGPEEGIRRTDETAQDRWRRARERAEDAYEAHFSQGDFDDLLRSPRVQVFAAFLAGFVSAAVVFKLFGGRR